MHIKNILVGCGKHIMNTGDLAMATDNCKSNFILGGLAETHQLTSQLDTCIHLKSILFR